MTLLFATVAVLCLVGLVVLVVRLERGTREATKIASQALQRERYYRESATQMFDWAQQLARCCEEQQVYIREMQDEGDWWKQT